MAEAQQSFWSALPGILSAGAGLYDIFGSGSQSARGISTAAAAAADPFAGQRGQYYSPLSQLALGASPEGTRRGTAAELAMGRTTDPLSLPSGQRRETTATSLMDLFSGKFSPTDPSYQWRLDQGLDAITRKAAAAGFTGSGNVLKELTDYGQGLASTEYGNQFQRALQTAQFGQGQYQGDVANALGLAGFTENQYGNQAQLLAKLAGVDAGSPAEAGRILGGRYDQRNDALANIGGGLRSSGVQGLLGQLGDLADKIPGLKDLLGQGKNLFDFGGAATYGAGDTPANLASLYSDYGWGEAADMGGGSAVDSLSAADWSSIFGGGGGEAATFGAGDTAANLAAYYGADSFGAGSAAAATGAGAGAATFSAGDTAANLAAFYGGYTPVAAEGTAAGAAGFGGGAAGEGAGLLSGVGGFAAAAALPAIAWVLSSHQDAKDEQRWNEAQQQYGPAFQSFISAHPEAQDAYLAEYKQRASGGGNPIYAGVAATKALIRKYPELPRIISENWIGKFFGNEYAAGTGELRKQFPYDAGYTGTGMGDA